MNRDNYRKTTIEQLNAQYGKIPPQAIEVEEAVLGALMLSGETIYNINGIIDTQSFYKDEHQKIFECIKSLESKSKSIDLLTVTEALKNNQQLDEVGGPAYITQLTSRVSSSAHIEFHARIIQQKFIQRELIRIGSETSTECYDDSADIEDLISNLRQKMSVIDNYFAGNNSGKEQSFVLKEAVEEIEKDYLTAKNNEQPGITTGIFELNKLTGGWRKTNFIIIASRPSEGKTSLSLFLAKKAAEKGNWVNFYGLEMLSKDLARVHIAGESGIDRLKITNGSFEDSDWEKINRAINRLEKLPIIWFDYADITSGQIKYNTIRNKKSGKCDLIIIDYIQLVTPTDKKVIREQQISEISRTLKKLALSENIPVIALAQLNRDIMPNTEPLLKHLRESGSLEQDSDIVIFPWWDNEKFNLTVAKNRRGKKDTFEISVNEDFTFFGDKSNRNEKEFVTKSYYEPDKY